MPVWQSVLLVGSGAALGAVARWGLSQLLNPLFSLLVFGTLIANYTGCFIIGLLLAAFWQYPQIASAWRLFLVTGFLGGLTTFSSFSAEVVEYFLGAKWLAAFTVMSLHLFGSLLFTALGVLLWRYFS
ncbi:fluoride efflux transporter CrcB [Necropsobacter massiliensis]|uniref:fluoride efflux transporter CrcB n=1 Tax=Necropsobacter massiliensis TaxID=1400001 RepID=UPI0005961DE0|nr:fluoride efflux transporter CrcB [Necropsobacter massiliensis]